MPPMTAKDALDTGFPLMTEFANANKCDSYILALYDDMSQLVDSRKIEGSADIVYKVLEAKAHEVNATGKKNEAATPTVSFMCCQFLCIIMGCRSRTDTMGAAPFTYEDDQKRTINGVLTISGGTSAQDGDILDQILTELATKQE